MAIEAESSSSDGFEKYLHETEWNRLKEFRLKEGFVGGKSQGEESTLQNGFNQGYKKGFEISYPISVIKGLLAVNKLLLKDDQTILLIRAQQIKDSLDNFERKCSDFKLNFVHFPKQHSSESVDISNDNVDHFLNEMTCSSSEGTINVDKNKVNKINSEFSELKKEILSFLRNCKQSLILDQISEVFEKWEEEQITQFENPTLEGFDSFRTDEVALPSVTPVENQTI